MQHITILLLIPFLLGFISMGKSHHYEAPNPPSPNPISDPISWIDTVQNPVLKLQLIQQNGLMTTRCTEPMIWQTIYSAMERLHKDTSTLTSTAPVVIESARRKVLSKIDALDPRGTTLLLAIDALEKQREFTFPRSYDNTATLAEWKAVKDYPHPDDCVNLEKSLENLRQEHQSIHRAVLLVILEAGNTAHALSLPDPTKHLMKLAGIIPR